MIAAGIVAGVGRLELQIPLIVRLEGTNVDAGKDIIRNSGLNILAADDDDGGGEEGRGDRSCSGGYI